MKIKYSTLALAVVIFSSTLLANGKFVDELAAQAVSDDTPKAALAISELRTMGPVGLDALFVKYAADIDRYNRTGEADENWRRVASALDAVAMQKDAYASHLYWYTDLEEAKRVAAAKHKPVLTLRLLGNLNEEFSCANSRLFRAVLYPNAEISKYLRENYILHWRSVRPAPRITIDFGDGRKIERTVTGNSIHYILSSNGRVIDALPGLYSPLAFLKYITAGSEMNRVLRGLPNEKHELALLKYRKMSFDQIIAKRNKGVEVTGVKLTETRPGTVAIQAAPIAAAKSFVVNEYSLLRVYDDFAKFEATINFADWDKLARAYSPTPGLDATSNDFIRRQNLNTGLTQTEFDGLFSKLNRFVALDTTRNDFLFHTKLYEWLNRTSGADLESLNAEVYDKIFQTPNSDKWLGLYSSDVYTALDGNGIVK